MECDVVSFATDSIITTKKIEVNSTELGEFALENKGSDVHLLQNESIGLIENGRNGELVILVPYRLSILIQ